MQEPFWDTEESRDRNDHLHFYLANSSATD